MTMTEILRDYALVINCDGAASRLDLMRRAVEKEGLPMPRRVGAIALRKLKNNRWWLCRRNRYFAANVAASHCMCVRMAQALGWPCVFVFEDDAWPMRGALAALESALSAAPQSGVIRFNYNVSEGCRVRTGGAAQLIFADAYQTYLKAYRADIPCYNADHVFTTYAPLAKVTDYGPQVFSQIASWAGAHSYQKTSGHPRWAATPPEGFPTYEEVMGEETRND